MTLIEQSVDSDDLQQASPEAGDFSFTFYQQTVRSWFIGETVLSVQVVTQSYFTVRPRETVELKSSGSKREMNAVLKGFNSDVEKWFEYIRKSFSKSVAGCLSVSMWCCFLFSLSLTWFKNRELMFFYHFPPTHPLLHLPKTLNRIPEQGGESAPYLKKSTKKFVSVGDSKNKRLI